MLIYLIDFLRKYLTNNSRNRVKNFIYKARNKSKRILRLIYGTVNNEEIFNSVLNKIGNDYDILMIHSSYNSMIQCTRTILVNFSQ